MENIKESLGIPALSPWYLEVSPDKDMNVIMEQLISHKILMREFFKSDTFKKISGKEYDVQFINYGKTQLVFVVTVDNSKQYTLLVDQPATKFGVGKQEYDNLNILNSLDPELVVKPIDYYEYDNRELYITPYYYQARCIGVNVSNWGMWIPEPSYHFEEFNEEEKRIVNSTMVAMIIKLFDEKNNKGLSKCVLDGGDFMLLKDYSKNIVSYDNALKNIKLIAARELISISLEDYIDRIRKELSTKDISEDETTIIKRKLREPLTKDEIETGISMGLTLRNNKNRKVK